MSENRSKCDPILYPSEYVTTIVHYVLGERCRGSFIMIPTVFVYSVILILGLFGNIFTCIVIAKNKSMHNPTNYYLFSLAISDLLMLILGLPVELYEVFVPAYPTHLNFLTCKLRAFLIEFTSYASVLTITCFSIERWLAICFPLRAQLFSTLYRATRIIISVWIISFFSASPIMSLVIINKVKLPDNDTGLLIPEITMDNLTILYTDYCSLDSGNLLGQKFMIYSAFLFFFFFPAMLISLVYYHIVQTLKKADEYLHAGNRSSVRSNSKNRKSILRMLGKFIEKRF
uniref:G-protein coupled receptors family 1 profile domain-containing protein n=1 Tax=Panagrolaimus sp. JU765 TaxID=591449 RepID=A0AC34QSJ7_9BILA